jgi:glycine/D-amino acid oxidase-like deaminating enzyme
MAFPDEPAGILVLAREQDASALARVARDLAVGCPEVEPTLLDGPALAEAEPLLAPGLAACHLRTGWPVRPEAATLAYARLARERGAVLHTGAAARLWIEDGRARGVVVDGVAHPAGAVLVAAGPWTPELVDPTGAWRPIQAVWGVNVEVALPESPRHVLEEAGVEFAMGGAPPPQVFSLVTADGASALGSTFLDAEPDPEALAPGLLRHGAAFVPALAEVREAAARVCARPLSVDGRPLLGPLPNVEGLWVASGHGPWGISLGPASAALVAAAMRDDGVGIPADLAAARTCAA